MDMHVNDIDVSVSCAHHAFMKNFGEDLRKLRAHRRMSQTRLSEMSGITVRSIVRIERGQCAPSLDTIALLIGALGASVIVSSRGIEVIRDAKRFSAAC